MLLKRLLRMLLLVSAAAILPLSGAGLGLTGVIGCGVGLGGEVESGSEAGVAAPPISLPAPVTGRLTITSPDESGASLVIGDEGAVPADALVHAVNSSRAAALMTLKAMDLSELPDICSQSFHACTIADSTGSFELEIQATDGDGIGVEILDQTTGKPISERFNKEVPRNIRNFVRPVLDVAYLYDLPSSTQNLYALMPSTDDDPNGRIAVVDLATETRRIFPFVGSEPRHMTISPGHMLGAIIDSKSNLLSVVDLVSEDFASPSLVLNAPNPRDAIFTSDGLYLLLATTSSPFLLKFDPVSGEAVSLIGNNDLSAKLPGATNVVTRALDLAQFTSESVPGEITTYDLVAFVGMYDVGGRQTPAIGLLDPLGDIILDIMELPAGAEPRDVAFYKTENRILVTDEGNNKIWIYSFDTLFPTAGGVATLTLEGEITDPSGIIVTPLKMTVDSASGLAFVNANNGTETKPDTVLTIDLELESVVEGKPVGLDPTGLAFDPVANVLYVSTYTTHAITFWGLSDLLP